MIFCDYCLNVEEEHRLGGGHWEWFIFILYNLYSYTHNQRCIYYTFTHNQFFIWIYFLGYSYLKILIDWEIKAIWKNWNPQHKSSGVVFTMWEDIHKHVHGLYRQFFIVIPNYMIYKLNDAFWMILSFNKVCQAYACLCSVVINWK